MSFKAWLQGFLNKMSKKGAAESAPGAGPAEAEGAPSGVSSSPEPSAGVKRRGWDAPGAFAVGWATNVGLVRDHNEDALLVAAIEQDANNAVPAFGLFMVADGMGGHQSGEAASSLALRIAGSQLLSQVYLPLIGSIERMSDQPSLTDMVREAIAQANRVVTRDLPGSGCTLTCGMILEDRLFVGHVGDSRAYLLRPGQPPQQLTRDHSLVNRLVEMGQITQEEGNAHPQRNVLYRAVGQGSALEIDVTTHALSPGDRLLLCSDGLWGFVAESKIWHLIQQAATPQQACAQLVEAANAVGGNDNISVILVEVWQNKGQEGPWP